MTIPWAVLIALAVLGLAYLVKHVACEIIEEENEFFYIVTIFIVVYVSAALAINALNPTSRQHETYSAVFEEKTVSI